jgi:hypothetical protein
MRRAICTVCLCLCTALAFAQGPTTYQPQLGQEGKDVVWVPTPERIITRMLQMADTTSRDLVVDLGSGDGRIPIAAARDFGARGLGVEFDENLVELSRRSAAELGVADRARFVRQDLFQADLSEATVIALYVSLDIMEKLRPKLLALKPGIRVVSHQFTLGDWEPDEQVIAERRNAYLWVVPARVEGSWQLSLGGDTYEIRLQQAHQMLKGSAEFRGKQSPLFSAWLRGEELRISFVDRNGDPRSFLGRVTGDTMKGLSSAHGQPDLAWTARRQREGGNKG